MDESFDYYLLSKSYTNLVALGIGGLRVDDVNKTVYFTIAATGEEKSITLPVPKDGVSLDKLEVDANNQLIAHYSDGRIEPCGTLPVVTPESVETIVEEKVVERIETQLDENIQEKVYKAVEEAIQNNVPPTDGVEDEINSWF